MVGGFPCKIIIMFESFGMQWIDPHSGDLMDVINSSEGKTQSFLDPTTIPTSTNEHDTIQASVHIVEANIETENTTIGRIYKDEQLIVVCHELMYAIEKSSSYKYPWVFSRQTFQDHIEVQYAKWEYDMSIDPSLQFTYQKYLDDVVYGKCDPYGNPYKSDGTKYTEWQPHWVYTKPHLIHATHYLYGGLNGDSEMMEGRNDFDAKKPKGFRVFLDSTQLLGRKEMRHQIDTNYWQNGKLTLYFLQFKNGVEVTHNIREYPGNPIVIRIECASRYQYRKSKPYPFSYALGSVFHLDQEMVVKDNQIGPSKKSVISKVILFEKSDEKYKRPPPTRVNQYY